jgi:hypothetical protein
MQRKRARLRSLRKDGKRYLAIEDPDSIFAAGSEDDAFMFLPGRTMRLRQYVAKQ